MSEDKDFTTTPKDEDGELQLAGAVVRGQFGNSIFISTPIKNRHNFFLRADFQPEKNADSSLEFPEKPKSK